MNNYQYNLFTSTHPHPIFVCTDVNLLEMYKAALVSGANHIVWEQGVISLNQVIGIMDISPPPTGGVK